jgi:hypothetical protein
MNVDYLLLYLCLFTIHHHNLCTGSSYEIGYVSFQVYNGICPHSKPIFLNSFFFFCSNGLLLQFVFFLFVYFVFFLFVYFFFFIEKKETKKTVKQNKKKITATSLPQYCGGGGWMLVGSHGCISINLECTSSKQKHKKLLYCF